MKSKYYSIADVKIIYGDGITDDTEALQAYLDGKEVIWVGGNILRISKTLIVKNGQSLKDLIIKLDPQT